MPPKTKLPNFEGEGNPVEVQTDIPLDDTIVAISVTEREVLKKLLDRDRTSRLMHGGLKSLLTFNDYEIGLLLGFLDRI